METTVCTVTPKITNVEVDYSHVINTRTRPDGTLADIAAPPTLSAMNTLFDMVYFSQAIATNSMGDKLRALITEVDDKTLSDSTILRNTASDLIVQSSGTHGSTGRIHPRRHRVQCICKNSRPWSLPPSTESL
jgi:hypothetical protein